ncbi:hypothetical protein EI94DRAFT_1699337 [Lactarius quietus]|nr:hypothetical protein EI94DRAFT_1699337 [Lactarius quietus]
MYWQHLTIVVITIHFCSLECFPSKEQSWLTVYLDVNGSDEDASIVAKYLPIGALALAVTAVEKTLQLCANGKMKALSDEPVDKQPSKLAIKAKSKLNPHTSNVSNIIGEQ